MKVLIIGGSGKIGKFLKDSNKNYFFTYFKNKIPNGIKFDLSSDNVSSLIKKFNINKIILLSAISDPDECFKNKKKSHSINVKYTKNLISKIKNKDIHLIFISTEFVYSGNKGNYSEKSITNPINLYGRQKLLIENYIKKNITNYSILRIAKTYGDNIHVKGLLTDFLNLVQKGQRNFFGAYDQIFNPLYVKDLKKIIQFFLKKNITGTFNVCGPKSYSRYKIYNLIYKKLKKKYPNLKLKIKKISINNFKFPEKRPKNLSLKSNKLEKLLNFKISNIEDIIQKLIKNLKYEKLNRR